MNAKPDKIAAPDWKFFGLGHGAFKLAVTGSFVCLILPIIFWMYRNYFFTSPFVPNNSGLHGTDLYGRNMEGDLYDMSRFFLIENLIVLAVLLPYSFSRNYWLRALILLFFTGFWTFVLFLTAMHSSGLYVINAVGMFGIDCLIFGWTLFAFFAEQKNRKVIFKEWNNHQQPK